MKLELGKLYKLKTGITVFAKRELSGSSGWIRPGAILMLVSTAKNVRLIDADVNEYTEYQFLHEGKVIRTFFNTLGGIPTYSKVITYFEKVC